MEKNMLMEINDLCKDFSGVTVLEGIDLVIEPGRVYGLAGENGAGKSTLCNIITGGLEPSSGTIRTQDGSHSRLTVEQAKKLGIRMVHQELQVLPEMSIAENIFVGDEIRRGIWVNKREMHRRTEELLGLVGLDLDPRMPLGMIDIAARQLIEIARASKGEARLIILDEPTSSLSDKEVEKLFQIVRRFRERGTAFIFISHRIEELLHLCDEIVILKDGGLVARLSPGETNEEEIVRNMVGRSFTDYYNRKREHFGKEILRVEHMTGKAEKSFTNAYTPNDVSFRLHEGEVLGIAGLVGAGRTEVVKLLFGQDPRSDDSAVFVNDTPVAINSTKDALEKGIIWVTEDRKREGVILDFSIKSNIAIPIQKELKGKFFVDRRKENQVADEYIDKLRVKSTGRSQLLKHLSGGNQQKVVMAKWLATSPRVLVLDEPTRGIDVGSKSEIYKLINQLTAKGIAVLLISSELTEVMGMSDRIMVMYEGRVVGELDREEFSEEKIMLYATGRIGSNG